VATTAIVPEGSEANEARALDTPDLVAGIVEDTRELVGVELEVLRTELGERISSLGDAVKASLIAVAVGIVMALLFGLALAASLVALGLPVWAALWIVTGVALAVVLLLATWARRAARKVATGDDEPDDNKPDDNKEGTHADQRA
jgi:hypothetical protein